MKNFTLNHAISLAVMAHFEQKDRQGRPYILHPLRVMLAGKTEDEQIVGVLHDAMEDNPEIITEAELLADGAASHIVEALRLLNRNNFPYDLYSEYIERLSTNKLATAVKINDLNDNLTRSDTLPEPDRRRLRRRYLAAFQYLSITKPSIAQ